MQVLTNQIAKNESAVELLAPILQRLQEDSDETIILGKRQDEMIVYLDVLECQRPIRYAPQPGERKPLHSSAIGKAMLSLGTDDDIRQAVSIVGQPGVTANTLTELDVLLADIQEGRERGIFITRGENVADVMGIAMVFRLGGGPVGIAIGGPMPRMIEKEQLCRDLLAAARRDIDAMCPPSNDLRRVA